MAYTSQEKGVQGSSLPREEKKIPLKKSSFFGCQMASFKAVQLKYTFKYLLVFVVKAFLVFF